MVCVGNKSVKLEKEPLEEIPWGISESSGSWTLTLKMAKPLGSIEAYKWSETCVASEMGIPSAALK